MNNQAKRLKDIAYHTGLNLGRTAALLVEPKLGSAGKDRDKVILAAFFEAIEAVCGIGEGTVYDSPQFRFDLAKAIAESVGCKVVESGQ